MSNAVVEAVLTKMSRPAVYKYVIDTAATGATTSAIIAGVQAVYGITLPAVVVSTIVGLGLYISTNWDYWSLENAKNQSSTGKVWVVRGHTAEGVYDVY